MKKIFNKNNATALGNLVGVLIFLGIIAFVLSTSDISLGSDKEIKHIDCQFAIEAFTSTEVFEISWGNGNGEVGLFKGPGRNYGPQSFAVDKTNGKVYILDSINQRILIYDAECGFLSSLPIAERADDLCLGDRGSTYVLYNAERKVIEYSHDGSPISNYNLVDTKSPVVGIHFNSKQGLFFETADEYTYPLMKNGFKFGTTLQVNRKSLGSNKGRGIDRFFLERRSSARGTVEILDLKGKVRKKISILKEEYNIGCLYLVGTDDEGNIYIVVEELVPESKRETVKRYLRKYDTEGMLLAKAIIPYSNYAYTFKDLRVTAAGEVYQLLPLKDHVNLIIWAIDLRKSLFFDGCMDGSYTFLSPDDFNPGEPTDIEECGIEGQNFFLASITREEVMSRAEAYKTHQYTAKGGSVEETNITTGDYCDGHVVITPITSPGTYVGIPYKWGGFTAITGVTSYTDCGYFFDEGLVATPYAKYAGDKNCSYTWGGSCCAVGVDCSGFVSQSWDLTTKYSTSTLPNISTELPSKNDLLRGDILDDPGNHVMLCADNNPTGTINVYEASAWDWKVSTRSYTFSEVFNYDPYRYNNIPTEVDVTVTTNPDVEYITVDGSSYSPPHIFTWTAGSSHNISTPSPQYNSAGTIRYTFANWSDGGSQTHSVSPSTNTTFTATFTTRYLLSTNVSPTGAGSVSGEGWYDPNTVVNLIATANSGYEFANWTGDASGTSPTTSITMNGPKSVTANFSTLPATLSYITISGSTQVNENSGAQYTCKAYYSDGSNSNVTSSAGWSENSSYASISSSGYLTTSSVSSDQSCTITATYGGKSDTHNVTIKNVPATLSYITISGSTQVNENSGAQYTCTAYYSDGSNSNVTSSAGWSENSSYASISSSGYLTTSSVSSDQSCTITATYGEKSDTHSVTIKREGGKAMPWLQLLLLGD